MPFERRTSLPENPFTRFVSNQTIAIVPEFTLESGYTMRNVPVAYKTWGSLNEKGNNCMLVCHALIRNSDIEFWWKDMMGVCELGEGKNGKIVDQTKFFVICLNILGSPYGTASPLTINPETGRRYGPEFPTTTIRDNCRLHKMILDDLGVQSVAICIGGSMAGMQVYEWSFFGQDYIKLLVAIGAPAKTSSWTLGLYEGQRQVIFLDPKYKDGYYPLNDPPQRGMMVSRMVSMPTYRTQISYERRFGRTLVDTTDSEMQHQLDNKVAIIPDADIHFQAHNAGNHYMSAFYPTTSQATTTFTNGISIAAIAAAPGSALSSDTVKTKKSVYQAPVYATHSYLRHHGDKFNENFDANCFIALTRIIDAHDISRDRGDYESVVRSIQQPTLICAVDSDMFFPMYEVEAVSKLIPNAVFFSIKSDDGHDGHILNHEQVNEAVVAFMLKHEHILDILRQRPSPLEA
ncbi:homoserine O- acetyltransferase [Mortierella sp. AD094]|nr:homoserine O- acetyltransferase [Mortierella sp. AD094]